MAGVPHCQDKEDTILPSPTTTITRLRHREGPERAERGRWRIGLCFGQDKTFSAYSSTDLTSWTLESDNFIPER